MGVISKIIDKMDVSNLCFKKKQKTKKSILKEVIDNPEKFKLEAIIEGEEIKITIKRREES
jgi:hypothetical protein